MTLAPQSVKALSDALASMPPDLPIRVDAGAERLGDGFHVTEIAQAQIDSLDCGGRRLSWQEAAIQVLDSGSGKPMPVGKLHSILVKALDALPEVAALPLSIDTNPGGAGLRRYSVARFAETEGAALLSLTPQQAQCKPVAEAAQRGLDNCRQVGCCA